MSNPVQMNHKLDERLVRMVSGNAVQALRPLFMRVDYLDCSSLIIDEQTLRDRCHRGVEVLLIAEPWSE